LHSAFIFESSLHIPHLGFALSERYPDTTSVGNLAVTMSEPLVDLQVQLPTDPESKDLVWIRAASIPISELAQFSTRPYRWMCYVSYCLTGVEGQLSLSPMDDQVWVDYDAPNVPHEVEAVYYHYPEGYDRDIWPIDVHMETNSSILSSLCSTRDPAFKSSLIDRDERDVLMFFGARNSDGAHLIKFSKGDEYIENLTRMRSGENGTDIITDINSVRNGLLINTLAHKVMGRGVVAFLPTPNFILDTSHLHVNESPQEPACTKG